MKQISDTIYNEKNVTKQKRNGRKRTSCKKYTPLTAILFLIVVFTLLPAAKRITDFRRLAS